MSEALPSSEPARSAPLRSPAVLVIGALALLALWLPPLRALDASEIPSFWRKALILVHAIRADQGIVQFRWDYLLVPVLVAWAGWIAWRTRPRLAESGLDSRHFLGALRYLAWPTVIGALILLAIGAAGHSIHFNTRFWHRFLLNSAIFQQLVLQLFFHRQMMPWFGAGRKTAWILTLYFAALHAPNPGLMLGTLIGMYFWARCYQKHPNLYALAISQAFLSALLMHTLSYAWLPSVSVGLRFVEKVPAEWWQGGPF